MNLVPFPHATTLQRLHVEQRPVLKTPEPNDYESHLLDRLFGTHTHKTRQVPLFRRILEPSLSSPPSPPVSADTFLSTLTLCYISNSGKDGDR